MNWDKPMAINSEFVTRDLGDEIILLSMDGKEIHSFADTGLWVWQLLKQGKTPEEILISMTGMYDVPENRARNDLEAFFEEILSKELVLAD
ncbi:MAG: PqqD family protein [Spirochaetales bacterium]|nr:PqqD family protein [Spirochaetales bacterium]